MKAVHATLKRAKYNQKYPIGEVAMRNVSLSVFLFVFSLSSLSVFAQPGLQATSVAVDPMQQGKVLEAMDTWMNGFGKKSKGRVILQAHVADGANPATHTFGVMFSSAAENEAFNEMVQSEGMEEWMAFLKKVTPISRMISTARSTFVRSWGDISDDHDVWIVHTFTARNDPSVVQAMEAWMNSPTGKKFPGEVHLMATIAGGMGAPSHMIAVGFESQAQMEEWNAISGPSADLGRLLSSLNVLTDYHGANLVENIGQWGKSARSVLK